MKIKQFEPFIGVEEYEAIKDCWVQNWFSEGNKSKLFVERLCELIGSKYGVLAPNGTLSLFLGLLALDIQPGDEVIVPNFTFIASATSVCLAKAKPVFVDIDKETLQIDIEKCEKVLSSKTKAIMPVHIYGMSCDMDKVVDFARRHNLKIIEDAAQAIGIKWGEKGCGSFGDVGSFSFFSDKTITTVEGGLVVTDDKKIFEKMSLLRNQGRMDRGTFIHPEIGVNFRMNDIQSAIGLVQLDKLNLICDKKKHILNLYTQELSGVSNIKILRPTESSLSNHIPFRVCIICYENNQGLSKFMSDNEIETRTFFYPLHKQPCFSSFNLKDEDFFNSIYAFEHGLCLPSYPTLTDEEVKYVCSTIRNYYGS
jgi:perosamine synthetase